MVVYTGNSAFTRLKQKDQGQLGYKTRHYLKRKKRGGRGTMGRGGGKTGEGRGERGGGKREGKGGKEGEREGRRRGDKMK